MRRTMRATTIRILTMAMGARAYRISRRAGVRKGTPTSSWTRGQGQERGLQR